MSRKKNPWLFVSGPPVEDSKRDFEVFEDFEALPMTALANELELDQPDALAQAWRGWCMKNQPTISDSHFSRHHLSTFLSTFLSNSQSETDFRTPIRTTRVESSTWRSRAPQVEVFRSGVRLPFGDDMRLELYEGEEYAVIIRGIE